MRIRRDGHAQRRRVGPHGPVAGLRNVGGNDGCHCFEPGKGP